MRDLAIIVAVGRDGAIGRQGDLIRHLPGDLARFKEKTLGHAIIMGRKTWESLPDRPLPGRRNIVISRSTAYTAPGAEVVSSLSDALTLCRDDDMPFIIGGGQIYAQAFPLATHLYLTEVDADTPDADTFFPTVDPSAWQQTFCGTDMTTRAGEHYRFADYIRPQ